MRHALYWGQKKTGQTDRLMDARPLHYAYLVMYARRDQRDNYFIRTSRKMLNTLTQMRTPANLHTTNTHKQNDTWYWMILVISLIPIPMTHLRQPTVHPTFIRLSAMLCSNIGFKLRGDLAVFTRSAITPPKVNRFVLNLEHSEDMVGRWPW